MSQGDTVSNENPQISQITQFSLTNLRNLRNLWMF
jgi:hypothetical protein